MMPLCAQADIISTKNNGNIENVKVVSIAVDSVVYKQGDVRKAIASIEVEGVLYDNGKFVTPPAPRPISTLSEAEDDDGDSWAYGKKEVQVGNRTIPVPKVVSKMTNKWGSKAALMKAQQKEQRKQLKEARKQLQRELREQKEQLKAHRELQKSPKWTESESNGKSASDSSNEGNW